MKKMVISLGILVLLLVGCGSKLTQQSFDDIGKGMTTNEVKNVLGKPKKVIQKQTEVSEIVDEDFESYAKLVAMTDKSEHPNEYEKMEEKATELATIKIYLENNESVLVYIYNYSYENDGKKEYSERELYFKDDKLLTY